MEALRESIGHFGILNPIIVRPKLEGYYASMTTTQKTYLQIIQELENKGVDLVIRTLSEL